MLTMFGPSSWLHGPGQDLVLYCSGGGGNAAISGMALEPIGVGEEICPPVRAGRGSEASLLCEEDRNLLGAPARVSPEDRRLKILKVGDFGHLAIVWTSKAVKWESTSLSLERSFTRVLVPLLLEEGHSEVVTVISSSSDAEETWRSGVILYNCSSGQSSFIRETLSLIRVGRYEPNGCVCCIDDSVAWWASIFRSTRNRAQEVDGQASFTSVQVNGVYLVGDGGGAQGTCSL